MWVSVACDVITGQNVDMGGGGGDGGDGGRLQFHLRGGGSQGSLGVEYFVCRVDTCR